MWGETVTAPTIFGFTGEPTDPNGLVHLRARYYDPSLGVFPSLDPVEMLNRYAYVDNNPINDAVGELMANNRYAMLEPIRSIL